MGASSAFWNDLTAFRLQQVFWANNIIRVQDCLFSGLGQPLLDAQWPWVAPEIVQLLGVGIGVVQWVLLKVISSFSLPVNPLKESGTAWYLLTTFSGAIQA